MYKKYKVLVEIILSGITAPLAVGSEVILKAEDAIPFLDAKQLEEVVA